MRNFAIMATVGLVCVLGAFGWWVPSEPLAQGQTAKTGTANKTSKSTTAGKKKAPIGNTQTLDVKFDQIQTSFIKDAEELADQYVDAGHLDKAKFLLESVLALSPQTPGIQQKIKQIDETILTSNDFEIEVNPAQGWVSAKAMVFQDRPIRIQADGLYRFVVNSSLGPTGFPDKDVDKEMLTGMPCGALVGLILVNSKPRNPFLTGQPRTYTPKETGVLFLRVNAPLDNKNTGKIKVSISGYVKTA